jgi:ubiquinone/menaquinone biosynthesis C-methylase UbiE
MAERRYIQAAATSIGHYVPVERSERGVDLGPRSFSDVDASGQASDHATFLNTAARILENQRRGWFERLRLRPGHAVLDAGSGMGEATQTLAGLVQPGGKAVGVDLSTELVQRARELAEGMTGVEFHVGTVTGLPFPAMSFDAVYSERVFMHLVEPDAAMAESFRVLRPGGRLVIVDVDHVCAAVDADDLDLSDLLVAAAAREITNPASGRRLRSQMLGAGFSEVIVEPIPRTITDGAQARAGAPRPLGPRLDDLVGAGVITRDRADAYIADQQRREAEGRYFAVHMFYLATAVKP